MAQGFGDPLRPVSGDIGEPGQSDSLAALLCRIARERLSGLAYLERAEAAVTLSFRDGSVVFIEDPAEGQSIPDMLLERGLLSTHQYAEIAEHVLESLADNEDLAFCQEAVRRQVLTQAQLDVELERWLRGRVIQAISWPACRIELELGEDALTSGLECPVAVGPLVYMGIRTFYDEERVQAALFHEGPLYLRLNLTIEAASGFFGLEPEETALFAALRPETEFGQAIDAQGADPLEVLQLLCMLKLAGMVELSNSPLSPERSGVRRTEGIGSAFGARPASQGRVPVPREDPSPSQGRMPVVREERIPSQGRMAAIREERAPSQQRVPAAGTPNVTSGRQDPLRRPNATELGSTRYSSSTLHAIRDEQISRPPASPARPTTQDLTDPAAPAQHTNQSSEANTPPAVAPIPRPRAKPRKLSSTLKRLDRDLQQLRQQNTPRAEAAAPVAATPATGHVDQLVRMRRQATQALQPKAGESAENSAELFRSAQDAMREQQFARAYELMRKASSAEPANEVFTMYGMWAGLRASVLREEGVQKLRALLRDRVSDDDHKAFAYYALGHIALVDKKDDAAEKFFRKAVEFDKHNKDAERHLRIIELRRKTAEGEKGNKLFGIEIKPKKG